MRQGSKVVLLRVELRRQAQDLRRPLSWAIGIALVFFALALAIGAVRGIGFSGVLNDQYTLTGERWGSLVSNTGILLWMAVIAITGFSAAIIDRSGILGARWRAFLVGAALVTTILLLDDSLSFHESGDDLWQTFMGSETPSWIGLSELAFWGAVGAVFAIYFWLVRDVVASTDHLLLVMAAGCFFASITADVVGGRLAAATGLSSDVAAVGEEGLKLLGIVLYASYFVRSAALAVRRSGIRGTPA